MQGNVVTAARWLGASMVLASGILAVGLSRARKEGPTPAADPSPVASAPKFEVDLPIPIAQRVPVLDPAGRPGLTCLDPPTEAEVWARLARDHPQDLAWVWAPRPGARIVVEKVGEKVDPCKVYPLAGPCELVHCHYKCSVSFDESSAVDGPIPINHRKARVEVVFLDKDHLRRCDGPVAATVEP